MSKPLKCIMICAAAMVIIAVAVILSKQKHEPVGPKAEADPTNGMDFSIVSLVDATPLVTEEVAGPANSSEPAETEEMTAPAETTVADDEFPAWVEWKSVATDFADGFAVLKDRKATLYSDASCETVLWTGDEEWTFQDMVVKDLDRDGAEEIIFLLWKRGNYGRSKPFWAEEDTDRLGQHIFIYSYELERPSRMRAIWMSSETSFEIDSIAPGMNDMLLLNTRKHGPQLWRWKDFGIKYVGDAEPSEIRLLCAGDNLIHLRLLDQDRSGAALYEKIAPTIREADIAAINLETILVEDDGAVSNYPRFGTPVAVGESLAIAGFDVMNLANNHVLDKSSYGIDTTVRFLKELGIPCFGATQTTGYTGSYKDSVAFVEKKGIRVAFLGYTYGTNGLECPTEFPNMVETLKDKERMIRQIEYARGRADVVVVYAHWGVEYETEPNAVQRAMAKFFAEHGVDIVIGSHPHVLQKYEVVKDPDSGHETLVYYSLGNFISGQGREGTRDGGLADITIRKEADGTVRIREYSMQKTKTIASEDGYWVEIAGEED
ncbi:MAG: CapA family protein [Lachnospiraceae bacterium]|nr:CapA family protein [Lachnospiraceae bacterium]